MRAFQESNTVKEEIKRPFKSAVCTPSENNNAQNIRSNTKPNYFNIVIIVKY